MTAQQLKNSILQTAVQGKLVPQDPNDEPASVLLERIRKEKEQLIKEGKIKREKNPSIIFRGADNTPYEKIGNADPVSIADEVPFGIPDSWEWVRLSEICAIVNGFTPLRSNLEFWENGTIPWFTIDDIHLQGRRICYTTQSITSKAISKDSNRVLPPKTVLLCCTASVGEYAIAEIPLVTNQQFNGLVINDYWKDYYSPEFLLILVQTFKDRLLSVAGKTTFNFVSVKKLGNLIVPVLPIKEQQRIVDKYNSAVPYIEKYGEAENDLSTLNNSFPEILKKSILQLAVKGKLVPQNPNDEPASVLLERICAEKECLIKEGKIKRDKNESFVFRRDNSHYEKRDGIDHCIDNELPFDIPETWEWCYLGAISFVTKLAGFEYTKYIADNLKTSGIPLFKGKNVQNGQLVLSFESFIDESLSDELFRSQISKKCLLTPYVGTIGNIAIFDGSFKAHLGSNVGKIEICNPARQPQVTEEYVLYYLRSSSGYDELTKYKKATAQESISIEAIRNVLIPIPPLNEQMRIVKRVEELFAIVKAL